MPRPSSACFTSVLLPRIANELALQRTHHLSQCFPPHHHHRRHPFTPPHTNPLHRKKSLFPTPSMTLQTQPNQTKLSSSQPSSIPGVNNQPNIIDVLQSRGLIENISGDGVGIREVCSRPTKIYVGFDPTADSLHVGNLLGLN